MSSKPIAQIRMKCSAARHRPPARLVPSTVLQYADTMSAARRRMETERLQLVDISDRYDEVTAFLDGE